MILKIGLLRGLLAQQVALCLATELAISLTSKGPGTTGSIVWHSELTYSSMTIDTACSGSLIAVDLACRYLQSDDASMAIVAGVNLYLSPEHNMDISAIRASASSTGRCHTFDSKADGYIKAEAVNTVILKPLVTALHDGDPIRAIIRGSATNSDGWTPGIASPSSEAQADAVRKAYARAGIFSFQETSYVECHETGTLAGDPIEVEGVGSVFSKSRNPNEPLIIGSASQAQEAARELH